MGSSRASAGLQVFLLLPGPEDPIFGMLPPPASPRCSQSSPVTSSARSAPPSASRARQGDGTQEGRGGRGVPCPDKLELLQGEPRMREGRNRSWERLLGCRDPPASACGQACLAERGGRCRTKAPSQQHHSISPLLSPWHLFPPLPPSLRHSSAGRHRWKSWN